MTVNNHLSSIKTTLRAAGLRATKPRVEILAYLAKAGRPLDAETVTQAVSAHLVTVYRTLQDLANQGIIYQTDFRTGKAYFEYQQKHHHHIICLICGQQEAIDLCLPNQLLKQVKTRTKKFSAVKNHTLEFFGHCCQCTK